MPFYQTALWDRLEYELTFNDYSRVTVATGDAAASYKVENVCLEFDMVTQPDFACQIRNQYGGASPSCTTGSYATEKLQKTRVTLCGILT